MNRENFGKLVARLRKNLIGYDGNQMGQDEFGAICDISPRTIGTIERGEKTNLTPEILNSLATGLNLTSQERKSFFSVASGIECTLVANPAQFTQNTEQDMYRILGLLQQPSFIVDTHANIIAFNDLFLEIYGLTIEEFDNNLPNSPAKHHFLRFAFSPEFEETWRQMSYEWDSYAQACLMLFRLISFKHQADDEHHQITRAIYTSFPRFASKWQTRMMHRDFYLDTIMISLPHYQTDQILRLILSSVTGITSEGELKLYTWLPCDDRTSQLLHFLSQDRTGCHIFR